MIIRCGGLLGKDISIPAPSLFFTGGVFLCSNGFWAFALTLPEHTAFGSFFDSPVLAELELLRQYPDGVEPFYFSDYRESV